MTLGIDKLTDEELLKVVNFGINKTYTMNPLTHKRCTNQECTQPIKLRTDFYKGNGKDGLQSCCKDCTKRAAKKSDKKIKNHIDYIRSSAEIQNLPPIEKNILPPKFKVIEKYEKYEKKVPLEETPEEKSKRIMDFIKGNK